jgi:hypothetical protein
VPISIGEVGAVDPSSIREVTPKPQSILMTEFVSHGYISIREAVNCLGRELFPDAWTGEEYKARSGLISEDEWMKVKDLAPARGGGATGGAPLPRTIAAASAKALYLTGNSSSSSSPSRAASPPNTFAAPAATAPHRTGDPSIPSYQAEYRARKRYDDACTRLRTLLEAGQLEAAILNSFTGILHRASTALWRRHDADRMIEKGRVPIPRTV